MKTLGDARNSRIPSILDYCQDDDRVPVWVNDAQERLWNKGLWKNVVERLQISVTGGNVFWPREVESVLAFALCERPRPIENGWFEWLNNGYGILTAGDCMSSLIWREPSPIIVASFTTDHLFIQSDEAELGTSKAIIQGLDENGEPVRSEFSDGVWGLGEELTISTVGATTANRFSKVTSVQKPVTRGIVRLKENSSLTTLGIYHYNDTRPMFKRSLIPSLGTTETATIDAKVRRKFFPALRDEDPLMISNLQALTEMVRSLRYLDADRVEEATVAEARAVQLLDDELQAYIGEGTVTRPQYEDPAIWGGGDGTYYGRYD